MHRGQKGRLSNSHTKLYWSFAIGTRTEGGSRYDKLNALQMYSLFGAFAKLRKTTIGFVMSLCLSVCLHGTVRLLMDGFSWKFYIWIFFENLSRKFKFHINRKRKRSTLHEELRTFIIYLTHFFLEWEIFHTKFVNKIKIHILWSVFFFRKTSR